MRGRLRVVKDGSFHFYSDSRGLRMMVTQIPSLNNPKFNNPDPSEDGMDETSRIEQQIKTE